MYSMNWLYTGDVMAIPMNLELSDIHTHTHIYIYIFVYIYNGSSDASDIRYLASIHGHI